MLGRDLLMPEELMRFKFGEAIFMTTRKYPIHAKVMPIGDYPIKIKMATLPAEHKEFKISCFDLTEFRKEQLLKRTEGKIELE